MKVIKAFTFWGLVASAAANATAVEYELNVELPVISEGQYHRPYVAIWIEDDSKQVLKNLALWKQKDKWLPDLKRYYRRVLRANETALDGFTGATKGPGQHQILWNGLSDNNEVLAQGRYSLCVEAAREKGGREIQCLPFQYGKDAKSVQGSHELAAISFVVKS
ncbi:DUF2271 domain-containing protein [Pseudoalteromonas xiamenensis]